VAILSLLRITPIYFNEQPYYGVRGFFVTILLIPFFGIIMAAVNWMFLNFGDYLYSSLLGILGKGKEEDDSLSDF
jgi:hypothetical protein